MAIRFSSVKKPSEAVSCMKKIFPGEGIIATITSNIAASINDVLRSHTNITTPV